MFKNYLKVYLHNLHTQKLFSVINVLGLSVGLTGFLIILLFIRHELSFDRFHHGAERIYRLSTDLDGAGRYWASSHFELIPNVKNVFPEIEAAGRILVRPVSVQKENIVFNEAGFDFIDPEIFQIFDFEWVQGDPIHALSQPGSLVLTESMAVKYFGDKNPLGQTLLINSQFPLTITGVIAELKDNTHLSGDFFSGMNTGLSVFKERGLGNIFNSYSYIRLRPGYNLNVLINSITDILQRLKFASLSKVVPVKLTDIHFHPLPNELPGTPGSLSVVYTFTAIAIGILVIASINFMNLVTARSSMRAKEVAMRKSLGADKFQLACQFLGESLFNSVVAMLIAIVWMELLVPLLNNYIGVRGTDIGFQPVPWIFIVTVITFVALLSGSYPVFFLSRFKPAMVLKGDLSRGNEGMLFRNCLVVFQFSISIALIIAMSVMYFQINFARNLDLGFNMNQIVILEGNTAEGFGSNWNAMKEKLLDNPEISQVTASMTVPGMDNSNEIVIWHEGAPQDGTPVTFLAVDDHFFETYEINLLGGRTFDENRPRDRIQFPVPGNQGGASFILNESAANMMGWLPEQALGKNISWGSENGVKGPVIGVVEDVYFESLRKPIKPMIFIYSRAQYGRFSFKEASIRIAGQHLSETLSYIDSIWSEFMPMQPIEKHFLDLKFQRIYQVEERQMDLLAGFAILAVSIACLGLYGLTAYNAERRTKEIGVRKVMGGSVLSIVLLLTNDFSRLVLLSNIIAWPAAYFAMNSWLQNFAYRIDLTPMIFIGSGLIALCIAWVTVGGTAAKAASRKPVLALRYE